MKSLVKLSPLILLITLMLLLPDQTTAQIQENKQNSIICVGKLPPLFETIIANKKTYFTHNGIFYIQGKRGYQIVNPPVGLQIHKLPAGAKKIIVKRQTYYVLKNVYYKYNFRTNTYIVTNIPV